MAAHDSPSMTASETLSLRGAAEACGVSESTIRRNREKLRANGAERAGNEWVIPRSALIAVGLLTAHDSPADNPLGPLHDTPPDSPHETPREGPSSDDLNTLRADLADARADAREWRARAEERERERAELIRRAEAAEATAREATATAAALALTVRTLEKVSEQNKEANQTSNGLYEGRWVAEQEPRQEGASHSRRGVPYEGSAWRRAWRSLRR